MNPHLRTALRLALFACALMTGLTSQNAHAQEVTGTLTGRVTDQTGAAVPNATVIISDPARGFERTYQTTDEGEYTASLLPSGSYTITTEAPGFKRSVQQGIEVSVNDRRPVDVTLEAGAVTETVEVSADNAPLLQESPTQRGLIEGTQVKQLPLVSRNFTQLATLAPGVVAQPQGSLSFGALAVVNLSINGGRPSAVNYLVDGARNVDTGSNLTLLTVPSVDAIQEFTVLTSNYAPEFGRNGGGVINVVTRAGTNNFNGTIYEFFRNDALNARDPFVTTRLAGLGSASSPRFKQPLRYNDFGYTVGGPVFFPRFGEGGPTYYNGRNKTFFFFSQEFRRIRATSTPVGTVPTVAQRNGMITSSSAINDPLRPGVSYPSVGGIVTIPQDRIDPSARAILALIPLPNEGTNQFRRVTPVGANFRQEIVRFDHNFTGTTTFNARYIRDNFTRDDPGGNIFLDPFVRTNTAGTLYPFVAAQQTNTPGDSFVASLRFGLSPTAINEIAFDYARNIIKSTFVGTGTRANNPGFAAPELFPGNLNGALPGITFSSAIANLTFQSPQNIENPSYTVRDNLTVVRGNHSFKFGAFLSREAKNENAGNALNGSFAFNTTRSGNDFADLLLGAPASYIEDQNEVRVELRYNTYEFYGQDTWKITPRFTLDYGARYSIFQNPVEQSDFLTAFLPRLYDPARAVSISPTTGNIATAGNSPTGAIVGDRFNGIAFANQNSPYGRRVQTNRYNTIGPRVGFAYNVFNDNSTVLRGGFGVYHDRTLVGIVEQNAFVNPLINTRVTIDNVTGANPPFSFSNVASGSQRRTDILPLALQSTGDPFEVPRTYQYSLGLQRQLFGNSSIEIAYVGTQGRNLLQLVNINQPVAGARAELTRHLRAAGTIGATAFAPLNAVRPFKGYGNINDRRTSADSNYNSAQATFTKRFSRGFQAGAVYTFSKNITDSTTDRDASDAPQDIYNLDAERAVSRFDRTHVFTLNGLYQLPFFRNRGDALGVILGGFQISGIYTAQSGTPITITQAISGTQPSGLLFQIGDPLGTGSTLRPNLVGDPRGSGTTGNYFNVAAFAPAVNGFGSAGRSLVRGPGVNNLDLSVQKIFRVTEGTNIEFRAEFFNALNHTQFLNPAGAVITFSPDPAAPNDFPNRFIVNPALNTNFGVIREAREARVIQFGLKFNY